MALDGRALQAIFSRNAMARAAAIPWPRGATGGAVTAPRFPLATGWLATRGWAPFAFQRQVWRAIAQGRSGLLHATTRYY